MASPDFDKNISRRKFLHYTLLASAAVSIPLTWIFSRRKSREVPGLKGLSPEEYFNILSMSEIFLAGSPVPGFDAGLLADQYLFQRNAPLQNEWVFHDLFRVPSSVFIAMIFDFSFTPMIDLPLVQREQRLLKWKTSSLLIKRSVYNGFRQFTLMMLTSSREYQDFTGYTADKYFRPFMAG